MGSGGQTVKSSVPQLDFALVMEKLSAQIIHVLQPEVVNSTSIKVSWEVRRNQRFIEGFHVKYRMSPELEEQSSSSFHPGPSSPSDFIIETVQSSGVTSHTLSNLGKYTWYEVRVQPFYMTVEGQDSNTIRVRTKEDGNISLCYHSCIIQLLHTIKTVIYLFITILVSFNCCIQSRR